MQRHIKARKNGLNDVDRFFMNKQEDFLLQHEQFQSITEKKFKNFTY